jgi:hypothetical protein
MADDCQKALNAGESGHGPKAHVPIKAFPRSHIQPVYRGSLATGTEDRIDVSTTSTGPRARRHDIQDPPVGADRAAVGLGIRNPDGQASAGRTRSVMSNW